jgi:predicted metallopeptidase
MDLPMRNANRKGSGTSAWGWQGARGLPLVRTWSTFHPLPRRAIWTPAAKAAVLTSSITDCSTGPLDRPFDFCGHVRRLSADIAGRCSELGHLQLGRMLFAVTQARNGQAHGLQARVTPLRFRHGSLTRRRRGVTYQVQRYFLDSCDLLYLVTFCLPRFLDLDFDEKMVTLFHELYHISPDFDGDLRRHEGRYSVHSHSQRDYDTQMGHLARSYLANGANPALYAFLRLNFAELQARHGSVVGIVVPRPKIIPVVPPGNHD